MAVNEGKQLPVTLRPEPVHNGIPRTSSDQIGVTIICDC